MSVPPIIFSPHKCDDKINGSFMVFSAWEMIRDRLPDHTLVVIDWGKDAEYYKNQTKDDYRVIWIKVETHEEYLKHLNTSSIVWGQFIDPELTFLEIEAISENILVISDPDITEIELANFTEKIYLDKTLYSIVINKQRTLNENKILKSTFCIMFKRYVSGASLDIRVLVYSRSKIASTYFCNLFQKYNNMQTVTVDDNIYHNITNLRHCNIIQIISADLKGFYGFVWCCLFVVFKLIGKPTFLYWIGSDVMIANRRMLWFSNFFITKHLAIAPWLVDELKEKGITAEFYQNPISQKIKHILPLPRDFTILAYLGEEGNEDFYGREIINKMIETQPYKFIILGSKKQQDSEKVQYLGFIPQKDMPEIYAKSTVLVRITKHDGFSNMVQEALNQGRYVIWSQKYPHCFYAKDYETVVSHINKIKELNCLNTQGMEYYRQDFNEKKSVEKFIKLYSEVLK